MIQRTKEKAGYVSIETVVVAGLMLALGAYAISQLYEVGLRAVWENIRRVKPQCRYCFSERVRIPDEEEIVPSNKKKDSVLS